MKDQIRKSIINDLKFLQTFFLFKIILQKAFKIYLQFDVKSQNNVGNNRISFNQHPNISTKKTSLNQNNIVYRLSIFTPIIY